MDYLPKQVEPLITVELFNLVHQHYTYEGNDKIQAGNGDDGVFPGDGADRVALGDGNDWVYLEPDGDVDRILCGGGVDTVYYYPTIDPNDVFRDCENFYED